MQRNPPLLPKFPPMRPNPCSMRCRHVYVPSNFPPYKKAKAKSQIESEKRGAEEIKKKERKPQSCIAFVSPLSSYLRPRVSEASRKDGSLILPPASSSPATGLL